MECFRVLSIDKVDILLTDLMRINGLDRVSGGTIIFSYRPEDPSTPYVLLLKRSPQSTDDAGQLKANSFSGTWEGGGGGANLEDETIAKTAVRETAEETGLVPRAASSRVYCVRFTHKGHRMAKFTFITRADENVSCQRRWSDEHQEPRGPAGIRPSDEHLDCVWVTEEQIRNSVAYNPQDMEQRGLVILESIKMVYLDFFAWLKENDPDMKCPLPEYQLPSNRA